jgi:hypothetical protein
MERTNVMTGSQQVFELQISLMHREGLAEYSQADYDATVVKFPCWDYVCAAFWQPKQLNLPEPIGFDANHDSLQTTDYVYNKEQWPILSKQMLSTLLSVGLFSHQVIPLVMNDTALKYDVNLKQWIRTSNKNHDFIALQLLEQLDIFDFKNSVYQRSSRNPALLTRLDKLVFSEPNNGFPPLFRVQALPRRLFISAPAKTALEAAGIRGIQYIPLEDFQFIDADSILLISDDEDLRVAMSRYEFDTINDPPYDQEYFSYNYQKRLIDPIAFYLFNRGGFIEAVEIATFQVFTLGQQIMYVLFEFLGQVSNGGFPQFFHNKNPFIHQRVGEALRYVGDEGMAQVYNQELERYQQSQGQGGNNSFFTYFVANKRELEAKIVDYINIHAEEFVIFKAMPNE